MKEIVASLGFLIAVSILVFWAGRDYERQNIMHTLKQQELENKKTMGVTSDEVKILSARDVCIAIGGLPDEC